MAKVFSEAAMLSEWECPECHTVIPITGAPIYVSAGASIEVDCPVPGCTYHPLAEAEFRRLRRAHRSNVRRLARKRIRRAMGIRAMQKVIAGQEAGRIESRWRESDWREM